MKWRQGRHCGIHVYEQRGANPRDVDRPVGTFHRADDAALACECVNNRITLTLLQGRVADALGVLDQLAHDTRTPGLDRLRDALIGHSTP